MQKEISEPNKKRMHFFSWKSIAFGFALIVALFAGGFSIFNYCLLMQKNILFARGIGLLKNKLSEAQKENTAQQQAIQTLQQTVKNIQETTEQQAQILQEWRNMQPGQIGNWRIIQARYLVEMANIQVQWMHNFSAAIPLLDAANRIVQQSNDLNLLSVKEAIIADLTELKNLPEVDITDLYLRLNALDKIIDNMPLAVDIVEIGLPKQEETTVWWQRAGHAVWQSLQPVIAIQKISPNSAALLMPDEKRYLYQNLHAECANAEWAVLHRNDVLYQASLSHLLTWVQQYFIRDASFTKQFESSVLALQQVKLQLQVPVLTAVNAFQNYSEH